MRAQARRQGAPSDERLVALASLRSPPAGRITVARLEPSLDLDALRFAAEDAVDAELLMLPEAQHADVHQHGAALHDTLCAAQGELDLLAAHLREGMPRVS